jgi:flavorubredoxin
MSTRAQVRGADPLAGSRLFAAGGFIRADGTTSWLPDTARGWQPANCYVLLEDERAVLIDTGVAAHASLIVEQLKAVVPARVPLSIFLTRAELDCIGNVGPISEQLEVDGVFAGGNTNPFDAFDAVESARATIRVHVGKRTGQLPIVISESRSLEVLDAPLRLLATYWVFDSATGTLFTSDSFGHQLVESPEDPRIVTDGDECDHDVVERHLLAKFGWIAEADTTLVRKGLEAVFADRDVEIIAPTNGCAIVGRAAVAAHYDAVQSALARRSRRQPARGAEVELVSGAAHPAGAPKTHPLPRSLAPGVTWLGDCLKRKEGDQPVHVHASCYLVEGEQETLMVDTGHPTHWPQVEAELSRLLDGRELDWIFPTHPELPHAGNLNRLLAKFPRARVTGDVRDYPLYCPEYADRLLHRPAGSELDLGGRTVTFLEAPIRDLPSTQWAYESSGQILFVADAFGYTHGGIDVDGDEPVHLPGECGLLSTELPAPPTVAQTAFLTRAALFWSRYVDVAPHFAQVEALLDRYPAKLLAPAHGNVISDFEALLPILRAAHRAVLVT